MQIIEQKKSIRKEIRQKKLLYGSNELDFISSIICRKVMQLEQIKSSQTILIYNSLPDEVQTSLLFTLKEAGKRIVLPVVTGDILILKEYIPGKLSVGYMNILEPNQEETVDPNEIDLAIIPGVAFDKECNRLGRGKGYYDKLLPCTNCPKIGICYQFQIVENIPTNDNDIKMDMVITDCNLYSCKPVCLNSCDSSQENF